MTIKEALELLRTVVPARERTVGINVEVMDYDHYDLDDRERCQVQFRIWDGQNCHYGPSLEIAVQKAMLANCPDRGTVETADVFADDAGSLLASAVSETDTETGGLS